MKVIVGLGNPGDKYTNTRHNVGFLVIDELAKRFSTPVKQQKWRAFIGETRIGLEKVLFVKPQTYMNLSGESVREVVNYFSDIDPTADVIAVYDDMDLPVGQIRLRQKGTAGGHNGVKSIIAHLGTTEFPRVRLGIGRPQGVPVIDYVLSTFTKDERVLVDNMVQQSADALEFSLRNSFVLAMTRFNQSVK